MGEMKLKTLSARHPCCDPALFRRYDALYRGGPAFARLLEDFLPKNPLESSQVYALRKQQAFYRSYLGPIIDFFSAQLFASPFLVRTTEGGKPAEPDAFYAEIHEDVDMNGTDLVTYMKARFVSAMVKGVAWILAEMPDDEGIAPEAKADWAARGLGRVRLCPLEAENVVDWECDDYGALRWAITTSRAMRRENPRDERGMVTDTWRLYDAEDVETFQVVYDPKKKRPRPDDEIPSLGRRPHRFPRVPLVRLALPDGLWLLNRAADAQIEHFRLAAAMSWAIKRTCYPMALFQADDPDSTPIPITGPGYTLKIGAKDNLTWLSPGSTPFDVLTAAIAEHKDEIYRIAQQMASSVNNNATALNRSGQSKEADAAATEICLHAYSVHVKGAMEEVFELVSDGRGDVDVHFSVEGMNRFTLGDLATSLGSIKTATELAIPSKTLRTELAVKAADMLLPDANRKVKDAIRVEIEKGVEEEAKTPPPPTAPIPTPPPSGAPGAAKATPAPQPQPAA